MSELQFVDQGLSSFSSLLASGLLADTQAINKSLRILLAQSFKQVDESLLGHDLLDVDSCYQLRNDIYPNFQVDLVDAISNNFINL